MPDVIRDVPLPLIRAVTDALGGTDRAPLSPRNIGEIGLAW